MRDEILYLLLHHLFQIEGIFLEPSALAGFPGVRHVARDGAAGTGDETGSADKRTRTPCDERLFPLPPEPRQRKKAPSRRGALSGNFFSQPAPHEALPRRAGGFSQP